MAKGLNHCTFIGNLGAAPELRYTQNGTAVANFNIAVTESWTKDGEKQERTEWVRCVAWGKLGEICNQYLTKGKQVYVDGKMQTRKWEDRDGTEKYTTEVVLNNMLMLGQRGDSGSGPDPNDDRGPGGYDPNGGVTDDDIPF